MEIHTADEARAEEIRLLAEDRRERRAAKRKRQTETVRKALDKIQAGRGGTRQGAGRPRLFPDSARFGFSADPVTQARISAQGPRAGADFLRSAIANLLADLARDQHLPERLRERMAKDDPQLWPVPDGCERKPIRPAYFTAPAALIAQVELIAERYFDSASQLVRVAVTREIARRMESSPSVSR